MIIDDLHANLRLIDTILRTDNYTNIETVQDARNAIKVFTGFKPDLILLDLLMPHLDGLEVLRQLATLIPQGDFVPIVVMTADDLPATRKKALSIGAKDFLTKPFDPAEVLLRIRNLLEMRYLTLALQARNRILDHTIGDNTRDLELAQYEMLDRLARASDCRDDDTGQHTQRVGGISAALAEAAGQSREQCLLIRRAATLHDVGKIGIPDSILRKPGKLTTEEFDCIKTHATIGARILAGSRFPVIQMAEEIALHHHERWDGKGYFGLSGTEIPLVDRIVTIADVYDVLTHARPYKLAWKASDALAEIERLKGLAFDPELVEIFRDTLWHRDLENLECALVRAEVPVEQTALVAG